MKTALLIFPHQLFREHPGLQYESDAVVLIEDSLFFGDQRYPLRFHKQKLWLHRATMKRYAEQLAASKIPIHYVAYDVADEPNSSPLDQAFDELRDREVERVLVVDPTDFLLDKRIRKSVARCGLELEQLPNPSFLNSPEINREYRDGKSRWFMADFYKFQRRRLGILMTGDQPVGEQWSFDADNRKQIPKAILSELPPLPTVEHDSIDETARDEIEQMFPDHPGRLDELFYPTDHDAAEEWLEQFLTQRLAQFGDYEDAIVKGESWLWHSVLTPLLNIGLLTPDQIVHQTLDYADRNEVPLNSLEGFVRQVIGWREFMRATYQDLGVKMRTTNHWMHERPMPPAFWDGTTGIDPIDDVLARIERTGYCHHIERLMVLGGFMFLCEIDPDEIYRWFMERFVDAYDWVMVPNVYAMSQHADGGLITTKPYFSGSNYIKRMSHYDDGPWADVWDGLYWRWIWIHRQELGKNPRWAMMCRASEKMAAEKRDRHLEHAESFLAQVC